jgi:hypothetical protein
MERFYEITPYKVIDLAAVRHLYLDCAPSTYCTAWLDFGDGPTVSMRIEARFDAVGDDYKAQLADVESQWQGLLGRWKSARAMVAVTA